MSNTMVETRGSTMPGSNQPHVKPAAPTPLATPQPHRRPRVREVSSRFMSPLISSSSSTSTSLSCGDLHVPASSKSPLPKPIASTPSEFQSKQQHRRSNSVQRQWPNDSSETDENRPEVSNKVGLSVQQMRPRSAAVVKLFKEKGSNEERQRLDTPIPTGLDRTGSVSLRHKRPNISGMADSAAAKLLQSNVESGKPIVRAPSPKASPVKGNSSVAGIIVDFGGKFAEESANETALREKVMTNSFEKSEQDHETQSLPDLQSSTPVVGILPAVYKSVLDRSSNGGDCLKVSVSPCARSLDFPFSSQEHSLFHSVKPSEKSASFSFKSNLSSLKGASVCLPPIAPCSKLGIDTKKGKKVYSQQEDVHHLRLLHNRYLQWRYANAKAEASLLIQKRQSEKTLYSSAEKISELCDSVWRKRVELGLLQRTQVLSAILEAQVPYLDDWSALEEEYSSSLLGLITGLSYVSSQLPFVGNIKYDIREVADALNSAMKAIEMTFLQVQSLTSQAEQVESLMSELARIFGGERAVAEECADLLCKIYISHVEESSLRGQVMQFHHYNLAQTKSK